MMSTGREKTRKQKWDGGGIEEKGMRKYWVEEAESMLVIGTTGDSREMFEEGIVLLS